MYPTEAWCMCVPRKDDIRCTSGLLFTSEYAAATRATVLGFAAVVLNTRTSHSVFFFSKWLSWLCASAFWHAVKILPPESED